jgi:hypothetical protein
MTRSTMTTTSTRETDDRRDARNGPHRPTTDVFGAITPAATSWDAPQGPFMLPDDLRDVDANDPSGAVGGNGTSPSAAVELRRNVPAAKALTFETDVRAGGGDAVQSLRFRPGRADRRGPLPNLIRRRCRGSRTPEPLPGSAPREVLQLVTWSAASNENVAVDSQLRAQLVERRAAVPKLGRARDFGGRE